MRLARFEIDGKIDEGVVDGDTISTETRTVSIGDVSLLPPCEPTKIIGCGLNYVAEGESDDWDDDPLLFFKPPSSVIGPEEGIERPSDSQIKYEGELGVIMGSRCRSVSPEDALQYVRGYTCVNDVTALDWAENENQWVRSKGTDTFCPVGPVLQTEISEGDPELDVQTIVNGETKQDSNTRHMRFSVTELIAEASKYVTLEPGDIIATGTPSGMEPVEPGDVVEVSVEGVGTLHNPVVEGGN